jgi:hypothetical protein
MSRSWEDLEELKNTCLHNDDMKHAIFWQNEQLMMKISSITWYLKQMMESNNV